MHAPVNLQPLTTSGSAARCYPGKFDRSSRAEVFELMPSPVSEHPPRAVAVIDKHEAIHAAVQLWCGQARPQIPFVGGYFSAEHFLVEHPDCTSSPVGVVVVDIHNASDRADFTVIDGLAELGYRVIVYTNSETDD